MIEGVEITPLGIIEDRRGAVMHMLSLARHPYFTFGEIYFSKVNPRVFKGWHLHRSMTLNYACVVGRVKVYLMKVDEDRMGCEPIENVYLGPTNKDYNLLTIPPGIWNAFESDNSESAIIANCTNMPYSSRDIERKLPDEFVFSTGIDPDEYEAIG